jgi:hypothetical protein
MVTFAAKPAQKWIQVDDLEGVIIGRVVAI